MATREVRLSDAVRNLPMNLDANVHADDRVLVRNVIAAIVTLHTQSMYHTVNVERAPGGYNVVARIVDGADFDIVGSDLHVIESVSPMRVVTCAIERRSGSLQLRVRILAHDEPVNVTDTLVTHVRKRRRFLG
jgi:hypothetical protein